MSDSDTNVGRTIGTGSSLDPSKIPIRDIIRGLNTGQVYAILLFAIGIFGAGFGFGERLSSAKYDRELSDKSANYEHQLDEAKQQLTEAKQAREGAVNFAAITHHESRAYKAKAEFLNRFLSYLQDNTPGGAMEKLFVDHVCVLWRQTQRDIFSIESNTLTLQDLARDRPLSPAAIAALAAFGIDNSEINEYRELVGRRSLIEPQANRFPLSQTADFQRLQNLESQFQGRVEKGVTTKTVRFFDGSSYDIPQPIATQVHFRADCKP